MAKWRERAMAVVLGIAVPLTGLIVLEIASRNGWVNPTFLPPPTTILATFSGIVVSGSFIAPLAQTLLLLFTGYGLGCVAAIMLGVLMGSSRGHLTNLSLNRHRRRSSERPL